MLLEMNLVKLQADRAKRGRAASLLKVGEMCQRGAVVPEIQSFVFLYDF